jgi:hypothetical protein
MWVAMTRETELGTPLNVSEQLTREQAIRLYTLNNAYLHHEENSKGSIEVGKLADVILIDRDILRCPVDEFLRVKVLGTIVGGKLVYAR